MLTSMIQHKLETKAGILRRCAGHGVAFLSSLFLFSTLMLANVIQTLSLVTLPFSKKFFRSINVFCAGSWWGLCYVFKEKVYGIRTIYTGDNVPEQENAFVIVNHQAMADILVLFGIAVQKKRLGNLKFFVKDILKYVPGLGWGMVFLDCLFLKRHWERDQERLKFTFDRYVTENIPLWLVSFVEGTRLTPKKLERSQAYAKDKGLPLLQNVLLPRTKGFVAVVKNLRQHLDAIYDLTIVYPEGTPRLWQVVQGFVAEFRLEVKRFDIATLPLEDRELSEWLLNRFIEKDRTVEKLSSV